MSNQNLLTDKKRTLIFWSIVVSCIATTMLSTALTTALPAIMIDLDITTTTGQWLTSGYSLVMGIMMPLTAFLITRFPTKKLYLTSMVIFIVGLFLSAVANNFPIMMVSRVFQACGNGLLATMAQVILLSIYPPEKRGTIMGWYGLSVGATPVIAPTIAGIIVDVFNWRAIFYISIIIMVISFVFAIFVFEDVLENAKKKFDSYSFVLSAIAFGGVTLGIGNIGKYDILSIGVVGLLTLSLITGVLFARRQLQIDEPFLDVRILKNKNYTISVISSMLLYLVMMGGSVIMPIYVQSILGKSATVSGLVVLPGSLAMAITSPFAGKLYDKFGMKKLFTIGAIFMFVSSIGMYLVAMDTNILIPVILNVIRCVSIGCLMMPLVTWGMSNLEKEATAHGTALLTSLRTVAGAIGAVVFVNVMTIVATNSADIYLENASIHGLNITFLAMSVVTISLICISIFLVKGERKN